ncbi:MAG: Nif3-like dinuclear metal center hexameric protein [Saprospiraceae bacterium]|nr:Nif3-like dinuclear metal center hexameric protein [Saprospiraceae bacterium]
MIIREVTDFLERIAPLHYQESYDNAGLIVGLHDTEVKAGLICLDATEAVIDEAMEMGCNLVIAHHPIIFQGLKRLNGYHYIERAVLKAIKNDIAIYAIHTNLDNVLRYGVNEKIAQKIQLRDYKILRPKSEEYIGSGVVGRLDKPMTFEAFAEHLIKHMELPGFRYTKPLNGMIENVALCGGSGRFLLEDAIAAGADAYLSADFKYHEYFEANDQIVIFDIGHYESEKFTIELLHELIIGKFSTFAGYCTKVNTNPLNYRYKNGS